jgi:hypothetical protein
MNVRRLSVLTLLAVLPVRQTLSAPEEIQVYRDEMEAPGHFGLDIHTNYVFSGTKNPGDADLEPSIHRLRVTPEFSYGLSSSLSMGLYLPLTTWNTDTGDFRVEGVKLRLKYLAPRSREQTWYWGINGEFGRVGAHLDPNPYNAELKGILGGQFGHWSLAANLNVDFKVEGPQSSPTTMEITSKAEYDLGGRISLGVESYNGVGELHHLGRFSASEHQSFLTVAGKLGAFDLDLGIGSGYGANADRLIVRAILGVPMP